MIACDCEDLKILRERKAFLILMAIMATIAVTIAGVFVTILYETAFEQQRSRLIEIAQSQARFLEAVARFDQVQSRDYPGGGAVATLMQMADAHSRYKGFGETGEFTLARRNGDMIDFLLSHRHLDRDQPKSVQFNAALAEPMRRALSGQSGNGIALDYRGETVLAAYEPVAVLNLGIVAKIDMTEIRAPFVRSTATAGTIGLALILVGGLIFFRVGNPMVRRLVQSERDLRHATNLSPVGIFRQNSDRAHIHTNDRWWQIMGRDRKTNDPDDWPQWLHPRDRANVLSEWKNTVGDDGVYSGEFRIVTARGETRWILGQSAPELDHTGTHIGFTGSITETTERKLAEQTLAESEERFSLAMRGTNDALWDWNLETGETYYSPRWLEMLGFASGELPDNTEAWEGLLHPDDRPLVDEYMNKCLNGEVKNYEIEFRFCHKDGHYVDILSRGFAVPGDDGGVHRLVGMNSDISRRKQAEAALFESEGKFRAITENTSDYTLIIDTEGKITYASPAAERVSGYKLKEIIGEQFQKFATPKDLKLVTKIFQESLDHPKKTIRVPRFETNHRDGHQIIHEALVTNMVEASGVKGIVVNLRDVSDQVLMELEAEELGKRMEELRRRLNDAVESFEGGFILFDADDRIVMSNSAYYNDNQSIADFLKPGTRFEDFVRAMYSTDEILGEEIRTEEKVKRRIEVHDSPELGPWIAPMSDGRWMVANEYKTHDGGTALIRTDITDRVKAEQETALARKEAEAANQAKSEFLSSMSHELRTPMNAVLGFAQLLDQDGQTLTESQKAFVDEILRSGHHMLDLIGDVLDLAKIESGDTSLDIEDVAPLPLIVSCLKMISAPADQSNLRVRCQLPEGDLPLVSIDALRFKQALLNLLSNAVKYNRPGGEVFLECNSGANGILHISVSDTGHGIPDDMGKKVFEPFDRLGAESSDISGTGIGLTVTKQLIESMGGTVGFESVVGEGTTFWINLPMAPAQAKKIN